MTDIPDAYLNMTLHYQSLLHSQSTTLRSDFVLWETHDLSVSSRTHTLEM